MNKVKELQDLHAHNENLTLQLKQDFMIKLSGLANKVNQSNENISSMKT